MRAGPGLSDNAGAAALLARVRALFPPDLRLGLGVARLGEGSDAHLMAQENKALGRVAPLRRAEFAAGRLALRRAQAALGVTPFAVPNGADRAPAWPRGFCGSISHAGGVAMAVLGRQDGGLRSLGLDIEVYEALPAALHDSVLLPPERAGIGGGIDAGRWAQAIFCIKECVYKAQYPLTGQLFGFEVIEVTQGSVAFDRGEWPGAFTAQFKKDVVPFRAGDCVEGRYSAGGGLIVSAVALRQ